MADTNKSNTPKRGKLPEGSKTGALYRVTKNSLIDGKIVEAGTENVPYDGLPGKYLQPMNAAAKAAKAEAEKLRTPVEEPRATVTVDSGDAKRRQALRDADNKRRGIEEGAESEDEPALSAKEQKDLEAQAEATRKAALEQSQESGGVLMQMTGTSPETVVPTTATPPSSGKGK